MSGPVDDLAHAIGGTLIDNHGDTRVNVPGGFIYAAFTGKVRLQLDGRVYDLGTIRDDVDHLVARYAVVRAGLAVAS